MNMSDNLTHLVLAVVVLIAGVVLIIMGHTYLDAPYIYGTTLTIVGAIMGFNFGVATPSPTQAQALSDAHDQVTELQAQIGTLTQKLHAAGVPTLP